MNIPGMIEHNHAHTGCGADRMYEPGPIQNAIIWNLASRSDRKNVEVASGCGHFATDHRSKSIFHLHLFSDARVVREAIVIRRNRQLDSLTRQREHSFFDRGIAVPAV